MQTTNKRGLVWQRKRQWQKKHQLRLGLGRPRQSRYLWNHLKWHQPRPFTSFKFTVQSAYWIIIGAAVIALALYVASLQVQINTIYDQSMMHDSESSMDDMDMRSMHHTKP
jgi:hypothetical protein